MEADQEVEVELVGVVVVIRPHASDPRRARGHLRKPVWTLMRILTMR